MPEFLVGIDAAGGAENLRCHGDGADLRTVVQHEDELRSNVFPKGGTGPLSLQQLLCASHEEEGDGRVVVNEGMYEGQLGPIAAQSDGLGTPGEQKLHHGNIAGPRGSDEGRPAVNPLRVDRDALGEEALCELRSLLLGGVVERHLVRQGRKRRTSQKRG